MQGAQHSRFTRMSRLINAFRNMDLGGKPKEEGEEWVGQHNYVIDANMERLAREKEKHRKRHGRRPAAGTEGPPGMTKAEADEYQRGRDSAERALQNYHRNKAVQYSDVSKEAYA